MNIKRISIELFEKCLGNKAYLKALLFAIRFKTLRASSEVKDYSITKLTKIMHCGFNKASKCMATLEEMGLVRYSVINGHKHMRIIPLRARKRNRGVANYSNNEHRNLFTPKKLDILIPTKIDTANECQLRRFLCASYIKLHADRKAYIKNRIANDKSKRQNRHSEKSGSAVNLCRGYNDFGLSRNTIKKNLCCGNTICSDGIKYGSNANMFLKVKRILKFNPNEKPIGLSVNRRRTGDQPIFFNRQGQLCIAFSNCYFSMKEEYVFDSLVMRNEILGWEC